MSAVPEDAARHARSANAGGGSRFFGDFGGAFGDLGTLLPLALGAIQVAGLAPVGSFTAGVGSDLIGPQAITLVLCGLGCGVAVFALLFVPTVRDYSMRAAIAASVKAQGETAKTA